MTDVLCEKKAAYRYTWPGKDEAEICEDCSKRLVRIADAMGLHLQLIPLDDSSDETCFQQKRETSDA